MKFDWQCSQCLELNPTCGKIKSESLTEIKFLWVELLDKMVKY